jgi:cytochrome b561
MLLVAFAMGIVMTDMPISPDRLKFYNWHKWAGVTILLLSVLRLAWRLTHRPPADVPMPRWQQAASHATHLAMYALFLSIPLVGWAYSSAAGYPVVWFGVLPLPDFVPVDKALAELIKPWHERLALLLAALVLLHIAAALKHQFVDRDGLLARMRPGRS